MSAEGGRRKSTGLQEIALDFISLFFPNYCFGCHRALLKGEESLCTFCLMDLPKTSYHLQEDNPIKARLMGRLPAKHVWAYLKFRKQGIVQHLLHQLKYNNQPDVGIRLGKAYGHELVDAGFKSEFDLIVPVPLHPSRKQKRGYNQSAKFAEGLSQLFEIPWDDSISVQKIATSTQTKKSKLARWENVASVFDLRDAQKIEGKRVLLVDDVITTGATIEACGQHLVSKGCAALSIACLAEAQ